MTLTRQEVADLLHVKADYLRLSNFQHFQQSAKTKGLNIISMSGRGKNITFEVEFLEQEIQGEQWKECPLDPDYLVSDFGRVKNARGGILPGTINKGYVRTRIKNHGQVSTHRLVMLTFCPIDNPENFSVDHINGIKSDNRLCNLRWVWQSENMKFCDENNTEIRQIIAELVKKYGYEATKDKLTALL